MNIFATIFDKNYLYQGLTLYNSLCNHLSEFKIYMLCMDEESYDAIGLMKLSHAIPLNINKIQDQKLIDLRVRTTHGQFCWACQPFLCKYILDKFNELTITYLEADSYFFESPEILFSELNLHSASLVPHNFSAGFDNSDSAGNFCVQFNFFRNNADGMMVLNYWLDNCLLYSRERPLDYPGQTCLDNWPSLFKFVKIINNPGAGVAPWNIQGKNITLVDGRVFVDGFPIIFYHYHQYGRLTSGAHELGNYPLSNIVIKSIYGAYIKALYNSEISVKNIVPGFNYRRCYKVLNDGRLSLNLTKFKYIINNISIIIKKLRNRYNIYEDDYFDKI